MLMAFGPFLSAVVPGYKQRIAVMLMMWHGCNDINVRVFDMFLHMSNEKKPGCLGCIRDYTTCSYMGIIISH